MVTAVLSRQFFFWHGFLRGSGLLFSRALHRLSAVFPRRTEVKYFLLFVEQVLAKVSGLDWKNVRRLSEVQQGKKKTLDEM